jgi:hypothetical protein
MEVSVSCGGDSSCGCEGCSKGKERGVNSETEKEGEMKKALYLQFADTLSVVSLSSGSLRAYKITPRKYLGLGLNLDELVVCLRMENTSTNCGVTVKGEYSFDGQNWTIISTAIISQQTADGDYVGTLTSSSDLLPFLRIFVEVDDTMSAGQESADISVWAYYKYRT